MDETWQQLKEWIDASRYIVFFGGAGVSTESGIPDFRSVDGLYNQTYKYPPETIISHSFFMRRTEEFYRFYRERMIFQGVAANPAHLALAALERRGKLKAVITQNIDGLHQLAGSKEVLELHGSIHRNYCTRCGQFYGLDRITESDSVPKCSCGGIIKPDDTASKCSNRDKTLCLGSSPVKRNEVGDSRRASIWKRMPHHQDKKSITCV